MADRIKFYMDEHVNPAVARGLRQRGVDALTAQDAEMLDSEDEQHLAFAASQERVTVSQGADFLRLHDAGISHSGIPYAPQHTPVGVMVRGLMLIYDVLNPDDMRNHIEFL